MKPFFDTRNLVKTDILYNNVKITQSGGIQVFDINNNERIKMGDLGNIYGLKATHVDGSETILDGDGFKRKIVSNGNEYDYIALNAAGEGKTLGSVTIYHEEGAPTDEELDNMGIGVDWVTIPNIDFKGRNFKVIPSFAGYENISPTASDGPSTFMTIKVKVLDYDYPNGKFKIRARVERQWTWTGPVEHRWFADGCSFTYYAYAIS